MEFSYMFGSRLLVVVHSTDRRRSRKASDMGFNGWAFVRYVASIRLLQQQQSSFSELSAEESKSGSSRMQQPSLLRRLRLTLKLLIGFLRLVWVLLVPPRLLVPPVATLVAAINSTRAADEAHVWLIRLIAMTRSEKRRRRANSGRHCTILRRKQKKSGRKE